MKAICVGADQTNFRSPTVQNPRELETALRELSGMIAMPHFRTKRGKAFEFEKIQDAMSYPGEDGKKAILTAGGSVTQD